MVANGLSPFLINNKEEGVLLKACVVLRLSVFSPPYYYDQTAVCKLLWSDYSVLGILF